jgi:zinc transport system permease protein
MSMGLFELFSYPFVQYMFAASLLASISCGIIGSFVVVKRIVFISGGIAHTTFGGIGLAYYLQFTMGWTWFVPLIGAIIFAIGTALVMSIPLVKKRVRSDSTIGVIWVVGMALGVLFLNAVDRNVILVQDPISILFGNILLVNQLDLFIMAGLVITIILVSLYLFKDLQILTFDEEFATISGINVTLLSMVLLILVAMTTVVLIKVVGVILVIAMLTIPAAISGLFVQNLKHMIIWAVIIGVSTSFTGSILSIVFDLPTGSTIVLFMGGLFLISLIGRPFLKRKKTPLALR